MQKKNCRNDFAPLKSVNLCPCTVFPEEPPQLFLLICCWHTGGLHTTHPRTQHYPPNTSSGFIFIYICILISAATSFTWCMEQIFIIAIYHANLMESWFMAVSLARLIFFIALWGNKETCEKHVPSSHISKRACQLNPPCYSLLRFCEQLQLDSALSESGAEGCRWRWGSHQWVSLWMRPAGVNGTSSFVRGSHVFCFFSFLFSHPCRGNRNSKQRLRRSIKQNHTLVLQTVKEDGPRFEL